MEPVELRETSLGLHAHLEPTYLCGEGATKVSLCEAGRKGRRATILVSAGRSPI